MRVLNKKYWPHQFNVNPDKISEARKWCYSSFKSGNWKSFDVGNNTKFAFKRGIDATMFSLRWS